MLRMAWLALTPAPRNSSQLDALAVEQREPKSSQAKEETMKSTPLAIAAAIALSLAASAALAQEAGFGNDPNASKNQVPAPSVNNPADPQAGNPGSAAQTPTAPQKQEDLLDGGATGAGTGEAGTDLPPPPPPAPAEPAP
jgi:hypothetical protein